ncbi:hypothetical protein POM88_025741 [Heracleum sosnowskyi]|uniref:NTF2 domain-containing protein n=1 Tax=Heracleum sosnowskyi TaxID=360622 RepID=A0AAD8I4I6_9APIA|nr:hypothetical protein POM88_025741 [Heracleum sosnowskyi]
MKREAALESPALSAKQEVLPEVSQLLPELSAKDVADAFVLQYYHILCVSPEDVHKFYKDASNMARPGSEGMMLSASTVQLTLVMPTLFPCPGKTIRDYEKQSEKKSKVKFKIMSLKVNA